MCLGFDCTCITRIWYETELRIAKTSAWDIFSNHRKVQRCVLSELLIIVVSMQVKVDTTPSNIETKVVSVLLKLSAVCKLLFITQQDFLENQYFPKGKYLVQFQKMFFLKLLHILLRNTKRCQIAAINDQPYFRPSKSVFLSHTICSPSSNLPLYSLLLGLIKVLVIKVSFPPIM